MERLLHRLSGVVSRHRGWFIYPQLVFFGVCLFYAGNELQFRTDPNEMFSSDQGYVRDWSEVQEEFQLQEDLVALVESEDFEKNRQFVERLAARLDQETNLFKNVFYKRDLRSLGSKGLLFLPEPKLDALRESLQDYEPLIRTFSQVSNLASLLSEVDTQMRTGAAEPVETHPLVKVVPALTRIVQQAVESTRRPGLPPSPGLTALFAAEGTPVPGDYLNFAGGRFYAVTCAVASKPLEE
ncbi:MAG: RND transporter, partial [Verrucomicrobia bacterium]|nr:RND transporter [Verrucomicrobiota bacterium]